MTSRRAFFAAVVGMALAPFAARKAETVYGFINTLSHKKNLQLFGARDTRSKTTRLKPGDPALLHVNNTLSSLGIVSFPWAQF